LSQFIRTRFFYGYIIVLAAFIIWAVAFGVIGTFSVFFKPLSAEFGWTRAMTSGAISLSVGLSGFLGILMGRLTDRFGPRLLMMVCGSFLVLSYFLMSRITNLWQFYLVFGVLMSIGFSPVTVPLLSTIARWFVKRRGLMTGIVLSGLSLGQMIMAPVAGYLILSYGWRTSYIILALVTLLLVFIPGLLLKRDPSQIGQLPYGVDEQGEQRNKNQNSNLQSEGVSVREALQTRQFWILWIIFFCFGFYRGVFTTHIVPLVTDLGFSLTIGASVLAAAGIPGIAGRIIIGIAADRIGNKQSLVIGFILAAFSAFWLLIAKEMWALYLFAVVLGLSWGGLATVRAPLVAEVFGLGSLGVLLGTTELAVAVGHAIGSLSAGWIFDISSSYHIALLISAALAVIAVILTTLLRPKRQTGNSKANLKSDIQA